MNAPARRLRLMPEPATPPHGNRGAALAVEGLRKRYGASEVLRGIDLAAAPGTFVAVIGRSGCGKSTLLRLLAGLDEASGGRILLDGRPLAERRDDARIMFQDARLLPWRRVLDNVGLGLAGDWRPRACAALAEVGLADRAGDWPAILSGGQRQRVALARALVHKPRLMLLDEPLGALDALTRIAMHALIEEVWREEGFTAVLVTHDVAEAVALADRVVMLEHGRVALDLPIPLPRPRARGSAAFAALEDRILKHLLGDSGKQP